MFENTVKSVLDLWAAKQMDSDLRVFARDLSDSQGELRSQILTYATSKSVFYREHMAQIMDGAQGGGQLVRDWQSVPFTTAEDIKTRGREMLCCSQDVIKRVVTLETSGTTGTPKRLYFTANDQKRTIDYFRVGMDTFTKAGDKVLVLLPCEREGSIGKLLGEALKLGGKTPILKGVVKDLVATFEAIETTEPDVIVGIPFQVLALVKYGVFMNRPITTVKKMLLSTDFVSETALKTIEQYWHCEVFRYYGMTETGFGGGIECSCHEGYHLYEPDFYIEIVDPDTGICLPEGALGEVVITTLKREGMPLIRYRTGDQSRMISEYCSCGSVLKRLDAIRTRLEGSVKLRGGHELTKGAVDDVLLDIQALLDYKIQFKRHKTRDALYLQLYYLADIVDEQLIIERLKNIVTIQSALEQNELEIGVNSIIVSTEYCPHPAKRKIEE
ncbi:DVU_1553 family AMP-dependent CoA ligase [Fusibacter ferrireducens]|uniref:Phenylacetate--CoA ligase family protein n=1 Tax=Fusibacter ferrireducens TaxID=2785058 RepID=A0ABR9ZUA3_9FIRM|nr:AMP-binding protein [Fusibacter ferrireducens]MBF4694057.1 phenylacetate--CoA ligase family protein [Fusibacter ferrireducens]